MNKTEGKENYILNDMGNVKKKAGVFKTAAAFSLQRLLHNSILLKHDLFKKTQDISIHFINFKAVTNMSFQRKKLLSCRPYCSCFYDIPNDA